MSNEDKASKIGAGPPQCQFFVQRKKRLCRMTVKPGRRYCGEHEPQPRSGAGEVDTRIPCPNDPKHTCYASKLEKHLQICNARRMAQPAYIVENINAPETVESCPKKPLSAIPRDALIKLIDKVNHLYAKYVEEHITSEPLQPIHHTVVPEFSERDRAESSRRHLRQTSALLWIVEREGLVRDGTCYVELGAGKGQLSYYACHAWCGARAGRVLAVDRAPLRHKRDNKLRSAPPAHRPRVAPAPREQADRLDVDNPHGDSPNTLVDVEADSSIDNASDDNCNIVVDDSGSDRKSTTATAAGSRTNLEDNAPAADGPTGDGEARIVKSVRTEVGGDVAARLRADLAHLALAAVPAVAASGGVVGLAKHLCGVATDYALRCVAAPGVAGKCRGVVLATCCHHRCRRSLYVANAQLQELGIDEEEFNILLGVVSWATCGDGRSRSRRGGSPPRGAEGEGGEGGERAAAGRRAKALLDWGRVLWLRARGFEARLCRYVPGAVSPENLCLVARKR